MKKEKLVYSRAVEDQDGARVEKYSMELTDKFVRDFTNPYNDYKTRCLVKEDIKNIWLDDIENLNFELSRDEILDIREDLKDELIENDPYEVIKLDDEDYGEWEQKDDECSVAEENGYEQIIINEKDIGDNIYDIINDYLKRNNIEVSSYNFEIVLKNIK